MDKTDYEEPCCPFDNSMWVEKKTCSIPTARIIGKEDEYLSQNDYAGAERHLLFWWAEAEQGNDQRGKLLLCNELMGLYRKLGKGEKAKEYSQKALALVDTLGLHNSISGATAYLNSGTVYKAFGEPELSLECFQKARELYEKELEPNDSRKAGLYNNMALTLVDLGRYTQAKELYASALSIVQANENQPDEAITWLNLADCAVAEKGLEAASTDVQQYLQTANALLSTVPEEERDGYYAYVCDKCAPVFQGYGYGIAAKKLQDRAAAIYAANKE